MLLSEGDEGYPDDNTNDIFLPLKYQTELLFTRWVKLLSFLWFESLKSCMCAFRRVHVCLLSSFSGQRPLPSSFCNQSWLLLLFVLAPIRQQLSHLQPLLLREWNKLCACLQNVSSHKDVLMRFSRVCRSRTWACSRCRASCSGLMSGLWPREETSCWTLRTSASNRWRWKSLCCGYLCSPTLQKQMARLNEPSPYFQVLPLMKD